VVTATRSAGQSYPGITYTKKGDFLLLSLLLSNDTREEKLRRDEVHQTLLKAIKLSKKNPRIELSVIQNSFVIPLTRDNYKMELSSGSRPDTSQIEVRVKTNILPGDENPSKLITALREFSELLPVVGRVEIDVLDDVDVSVVNPNQYREKLIQLIMRDIQKVTSGLGDDYRAVITGMGQTVQWVKSGAINLTLYLDYSYVVIPKNIHTIVTEDY